MQVNPYLNFNGNCEAAFKFYEQCFGGKDLVVMRYGDSPMAATTAPEWHDKVMHAHFTVGDTLLMGSDAPVGYYQQPKGLSISLGVATPEEAQRIFAALAEGGTVSMPLQQTFWAVRFGMVVDRFGIPWMVNCEQSS